MIIEKLRFIPKKYQHMVHTDSYHESREGGYWIFLNEEFFSPDMGCKTIHEHSQKQVLAMLKNVREITLEDALGANYIETAEKLSATVEELKDDTQELKMYLEKVVTQSKGIVSVLSVKQGLMYLNNILTDIEKGSYNPIIVKNNFAFIRKDAENTLSTAYTFMDLQKEEK